MPFAKMRALRPGDHVRVIAPSSPFDHAGLALGVERLRQRYRVSLDEVGLFATDGFLAGDDARRLAELRAALEDPSVDAIVCARGGYGATRLLRELDPASLEDRAPLLVGFSDITALHALYARAGRASLHGAMVAALGRSSATRIDSWIQAVEGAAATRFEGLTGVVGGRAEGPLVGGNLAVLAALVGTPFGPPLEGAILVLEDVGEAPYRLDRMLVQLRDAGWLARLAGVACGSFTDCGPRGDGTTVEEVLRRALAPLGVPVVRGLPVGHAEGDVELPLGAYARLDADVGTLDLEDAFVR